jgi:sarcosine oxidase subunit beta
MHVLRAAAGDRMKSRYSVWKLIKEGLGGHTGWGPAWRDAAPKASYDVLIIGGGGHGLATAYYLAKNHGIRNVAVLEKGWIGGGNTGRNTTVIRSNYYYPASARLYDFSVSLYERLHRELNYNVMFSQRGIITLAHSRHDVEAATRWVGAMNSNGVATKMMSVDEVAKRVPFLDVSATARFPVLGGFIQ